MGSPSIIYDVLRLLLAAGRLSPRGIDRVDLAYAEHLFGHWQGDCFGLLPTPWGVRLYGREQVLRGLARLSVRWRETTAAEQDSRFTEVAAFLAGRACGASLAVAPPRSGWLRQIGGPADVLRRTGVTFGKPIWGAPRDAIYLNVGQLGWAADIVTGWLTRRQDARGVFLVHDVIPLDHPELVSPAGRWSHAKMLRAVGRHARGVICTTKAAETQIAATLERCGRRAPLIRALHLPISRAFIEPAGNGDSPAVGAYFVMSGAIEPRKNHVCLVEAWKLLVGKLGAAAPRLVVVGSTGFGGKSVLQTLLEADSLRDHVMVVSGLRTPALRRLVSGAQAALMPSWAEGFGLPVLEALTLGTPVIASDLPAHREVGGVFATYLPPDTPVAWAEEIERMMASTPDARTGLRSFQPLTEEEYFTSVDGFLLDVAAA